MMDDRFVWQPGDLVIVPATDKSAQWSRVRAQARALLARTYDPSEPRDPDGKWGGGGGASESAPQQFTPHNPPTKAEQRVLDSGDKVTRAQKLGLFPDAEDHFQHDLPLYVQHLSPNTVWEFMQTPKGLATLHMDKVYGAKPTINIHWLVAKDRGAGRAAMGVITKTADKHGVTLQLHAVPLPAHPEDEGKTLPVPKLEKFYESFGFKKFGRRDRDGYIQMKRAPVNADRARAYDPSEPRDDTGKWSGGGGGSEGEGGKSSGGGGGKKKSSKEDFDKAKIQVDGTKVQQDAFINTWNEKIGVEPAEFKQNFMGGLDGTMKIGAKGNGNTVLIAGDLTSPAGQNIGSFNREINLDTKSAYSAYFKLKNTVTGGNMGKKMLAGNIAGYQKLGIETVRVTANIDVGGYAWAKYGYVPTQSAWNTLSASLERKLTGSLGNSSSRGGGETREVELG